MLGSVANRGGDSASKWLKEPRDTKNEIVNTKLYIT